jgi:hypothetical protein
MATILRVATEWQHRLRRPYAASVPTRSEPVRTIERLLSYPEAHAIAPGGRKPTCTCMACHKCARRLWFRLARKGIRLGPWTSDRARLALESRLSGLGWAEVAARHGYASHHTARRSVLASVALSEAEKAELRAVPPARRRRRIEVVAAVPNAKATIAATPVERLTELRRRVSEEALRAYRSGAPRTVIAPMLTLLDRVDARLAKLDEQERERSVTGLERRAEVAATRAGEIVAKGGRSAKPVSPAAPLASRRVRVASRASPPLCRNRNLRKRKAPAGEPAGALPPPTA